jgi:LacI family transcriptional regulator
MSGDQGTNQRSRGNGRVTLKFLASHLNLSPTTISVVISGAPLACTIAQATKDRIWEAVREFNYRPNLFARYLHAKRTFCVAVLVPDIGDEFSSSLISGIEAKLAENGFFYFVVSHRGAPDLIETSPDTLLDRGVEGMIFINTWLRRPLPVPVVAVSDITDAPGVSSILIDNSRAASLALKHLVSLGHRNVAFFKGPAGNGDTDDRWRSMTRAAERFGIEVRPEWVRQLGTYPECNNTTMADLGYQQAKELLASSRDFTALMAFNDGSAIGAIRAFRDAGLSVPRDISVVGFDDIEQAAFIVPRLTTIHQPLREMGELAAETLIKRIDDATYNPGKIVVKPRLVLRESTARPQNARVTQDAKGPQPLRRAANSSAR